MARVDAALAFLAEQQLPNGEFPTVRGRLPKLEDERSFESTTFATSYVLHSLSHVDRSPAPVLADGAADFLESVMERHGVWRYWTARDRRHSSIPPDLDDTCCASAALRDVGRAPIANHDLILANRNRAGLFYTWLVPRPARTRSREFWSVTLRQLPDHPRTAALLADRRRTVGYRQRGERQRPPSPG